MGNVRYNTVRTRPVLSVKSFQTRRLCRIAGVSFDARQVIIDPFLQGAKTRVRVVSAVIRSCPQLLRGKDTSNQDQQAPVK
jgi:hypothetical protein